MHKGVRIEYNLVNEYVINHYYNHYYLVKKLICEYDRHEHGCLYSSKVELRCLLVKTLVTTDVL